MSDDTAGWQADPTGRHDHRYWDGTRWTENVSDGGVASTDPYEGPGDAPTDPTVASEPVPAAGAAGWGDPTAAQPAAPGDPTAAWPSSPPPPVPPVPSAAGPIGPDSGGSKRGLLIGGGVLAAVVVIVLAVLLLGGDDDDTSGVEARLASQIQSSSDGALDDGQADCVAGYLVDEIGEDRLADVDFDAEEPPAGMEDELIAATFGAISECDIDPTALGGGGGDEGSDVSDDPADDGEAPAEGGEGAYGSDPELDALYDECEGGDYQACDDLFLESPSGSEYEDFGDTCGGRNDPSGYCVDLYEGEDAGTDLGAGGADMEEMLADIYEESMGLERDKAECLANRLSEAISSGDMTEDEAMSDVFSYLEDCDISMEEIGG